MNFFGTSAFVSPPSVSLSLAFGCGSRRRSESTLGASVWPGQGPWHVLWGFKAANTGK